MENKKQKLIISTCDLVSVVHSLASNEAWEPASTLLGNVLGERRWEQLDWTSVEADELAACVRAVGRICEATRAQEGVGAFALALAKLVF